MTHSETLAELFSALSKFQAEVPEVKYDAKVRVRTNSGANYEFEYATLRNIIKTTKPVLNENGLSVTQLVGTEGVQTLIAHDSGEWLLTEPLQIKLAGTEQEVGSSITYKKRYQLAAVLNVDADKDDDANLADNNQVQDLKAKSKSKPKPKSRPKPKQQVAETADEIVDTINAFTDKDNLVDWFNTEMDKRKGKDRDEFRDTYLSNIRDKIDELD